MEENALRIRCANPECGKIVKIRKPSAAGIYKFTCPHCATILKVNVAAELAPQVQKPAPRVAPPVAPQNTGTQLIQTDTNVMTSLGHLEQKRFLRKDLIYPLREGRNLIGRADEGRPSDISIEGDVLISRQSVAIDVERNERGFFFCLNVLNASNPVYHNKEVIEVGDRIYLDYGDTIQLGKTTLKFCK